MSSGVILLQTPYISFSSPLLLILRREITAAAVALLSMVWRRRCIQIKYIQLRIYLNPGQIRHMMDNKRH